MKRTIALLSLTLALSVMAFGQTAASAPPRPAAILLPDVADPAAPRDCGSCCQGNNPTGSIARRSDPTLSATTGFAKVL